MDCVIYCIPLDELINTEIKLKIEMKDCNLYSYTFEN